MLRERERLFDRMRRELVSLGPICAQMTYLPQQLNNSGKDHLFVSAAFQIGQLVAAWSELGPKAAAEAEAIWLEIDAERDGANNMTGEAQP